MDDARGTSDLDRGQRGAPRPVLIGVDLGKVTTSLAWAEVGDATELGPITTHAERHVGEPLRPFLELYRRLGAVVAGVAATAET